MSEKTKIKFFIYIPGDYSVGIPDFSSTVTIEDDGVYDTKDSIVDLKHGIQYIYDSQAQVLTELEFLEMSLKEKIMEANMAHDSWEELNADLDNQDSETEIKLYQCYRLLKKDVTNLKRKITNLKKSYTKMRVWH